MTIRLVTKQDNLLVTKLVDSYKNEWLGNSDKIIDFIDNHDFYAVGKFTETELVSFVLISLGVEQKFAVLHLFFAAPHTTIYEHQMHKLYDWFLADIEAKKIYRYYGLLPQAKSSMHNEVWQRKVKLRARYDMYIEDVIPAFHFSPFNQYKEHIINGLLKSEPCEIYHACLKEEYRI